MLRGNDLRCKDTGDCGMPPARTHDRRAERDRSCPAFGARHLGCRCESELIERAQGRSRETEQCRALFSPSRRATGVVFPSLPVEAFQIYEDDQLISRYESKQTILNPEVAVIHYSCC